MAIKKTVSKISKSWKYENCVFVTDGNGKDFKRNYYERKNTKGTGNPFYTYFDGNAYSFKFEGTIVVNVKNEGEYKEFAKREGITTTDSIKEEMKEKSLVAPEVTTVAVEEEDGEIRHEQYNTIKTWISLKIPVYLVGPAGSGKNHVLEQIAEDLGLDFYFTNSVQQEFKITGFIDAGGIYHETEFYKAFVNGGIFFLDEMDASIPEVLVLLNAAIANGWFEFPNGKAKAHKKFRIVAAGNTVGSGADEQYTGRLVLDQASLDRFVIVYFDYSRKIELHLSNNNSDLVEFVHQIRDEAKAKGIRATFSYRCITMVTKAEGKLELSDIMLMAVLKGMDKDTIKTFRVPGYTKYHIALRKAQGVA